MRTAREIMGAILLGLLSFIIVMGGIALTLAEGNLIPAQPAETLAPTNTQEVPTLAFTEPPGNTTKIATATLIPTGTPPPPPTNCPPPAGWLPYNVQIGQTIEDIARQINYNADILAQQNCVSKDDTLLPGVIVYIPSVATARPTSIPTRCGAPATWVLYTVKAGDNLYRIGLAYGVSVTQLKLANCLTSDNITVGQRIYVPNVPTRTPTSTPSITATSILTPSVTVEITTQPPATDTSTTSTSTTVPPTATDTQTVQPSNTPLTVPTATLTPTP